MNAGDVRPPRVASVGPNARPFEEEPRPIDDEATVSDTEADEMEEHLRGLGYLE